MQIVPEEVHETLIQIFLPVIGFEGSVELETEVLADRLPYVIQSRRVLNNRTARDNGAIFVHTLAHGQEQLQMRVLLNKIISSSFMDKRIIIDQVSMGIGGCVLCRVASKNRTEILSSDNLYATLS